MPPPRNENDSGHGQQTDYEQWATEQYGTLEGVTEESSVLRKLPQMMPWNERFDTLHTDLESTNAYPGIQSQLSCQKQSILLVIVSGLLLAVLALLHVLKRPNETAD